MTLQLTILGCGSSAGVPRVANDWGKCDPANPKNRRLRCSLLATRQGSGGTTRVLVDTSPDLRQQMLYAEVPALDAVWFTHEHADHTHGIDDLRPYFILQKKRIPCWADETTSAMLRQRFGYIFEDQHGYPAIASLHQLRPGRSVEASGAGGTIEALPIAVRHGHMDALAFRFGNAAYIPDVNGIDATGVAALAGLDILIIDALRYTGHPSHFRLEETLAVIADLRPKRSVITNMHIDLDYETLRQTLPLNIEPAFDGMKLEISDAA